MSDPSRSASTCRWAPSPRSSSAGCCARASTGWASLRPTAASCASGFVAGEGLAGVLIAGWALANGQGRHAGPAATMVDMALGVACVVVAVAVLRRSVRE